MSRTRPERPSGAECRCPAGWPITVFVNSDRGQVPVREHNRLLCGLPDEEQR